jgi:hypothetical protein
MKTAAPDALPGNGVHYLVTVTWRGRMHVDPLRVFAREGDARALVGGTAPKPSPARRPGWHPCGYPGCSPHYCDECDGKGRGLRSYGEW